ncbi:MAG: hypothetical protein ABI765_05015 [Gemmatimonadota bacterium]
MCVDPAGSRQPERHHVQWNGSRATGQRFSCSGATLIRLKGDKIQFEADWDDAYGFCQQLRPAE